MSEATEAHAVSARSKTRTGIFSNCSCSVCPTRNIFKFEHSRFSIHFALLSVFLTLSVENTAISTVNSLRKLAAGLREPTDYFAGTGGDPWCWPLNLLAFVRRTRRDLQRRTFESRLHTRYVLVVNLHTAGTLNLDSTAYRLMPGQAHLIFPHQLHTYHDLDRDDILWLFITFELPDATPLRSLRHATVTPDVETRKLLEDFTAAYRSRKTMPHQLQIILSGILLRLVRSADRGSSHKSPRTSANGKFLEAVHSHHANCLPAALSVGQLASAMKTSESRLRTRFRETYGLSLGQYLRNLRLQDAVAMMRHSQESLTDIAISCGFSSSAAFSRAFKHWSGTTPREFRHGVAASAHENAGGNKHQRTRSSQRSAPSSCA
ncbi:MAG: helix-turn-helix domain-containing protein [Chthoniobacterales bacterium]|nr:helix-turn-helix domain-containing protein [Chthoniobacterales bacterium]